MRKGLRRFITDHPSYLVIKTSYPEKVLKGEKLEQINPEYIDWLNCMVEQIGYIVEDFIEKLNKENGK